MKRVIITGVSEGLGYQVAKQLIEKGYEVIGISRKKPDLEITHIKTDLSKKEDLNELVNEIKQTYSKFDFLLNIAGVLNVKPINQIDYDETENLFKVNVLAPIALISGLFDLIKVNEADIITVGSTIAYKSYEKQMAYTASKWALRGIHANLQLELKGSRSRAINFNPGGFKSKIFEKATGIKVTDWSNYMRVEDLASLIVSIMELPKNMEVSEIIINRK